MIRLTRVVANENKPFLIDVDSIESVETGDILTEITTKRGWVIKVKESPEEIVRKVLEYRQQVLAFANNPIHHYPFYSEAMNRLAGLEEQKDE